MAEMTREEKLAKLTRLKELKAQRDERDAGLNFFDPRRYDLENIPSSAKEMLNPTPQQHANAEDLAMGVMGTSGGISKGATALEKLNPLKAAGKATYKSGFKKVDEIAGRYGKKPLSDVMFERGFTGTTKKMRDVSGNLIDDLINQQRQILSKVDEAVPEANLDNALQPLKNKIEELLASGDPPKMQAAKALSEDLAEYVALKNPSGVVGAEGPMRPLTPSRMNAMKTTAQNTLPQSSYAQTIAQRNPLYTQGKKALGAGLRGEVQRVTDIASPELGKNLLGVNADLGSLLTSGKTVDQEMLKALNKNIMTPVDAITYGIGGSPAAGAELAAAKKVLDLTKTPLFRTNIGKSAWELGDRSPEAAASAWYFWNKEQEKTK